MRKRTLVLLAMIVAAMTLALALAGTAAAGLYTHRVETFLAPDGTVIAKPATGGWVTVEVDSFFVFGDPTTSYELVVRRADTNQVVFDGPCVPFKEDGNDDRKGAVLGTNIRVHGARIYEANIELCSGFSIITQIRAITNIRTFQILDVFA
jgi:hypothetical protein